MKKRKVRIILKEGGQLPSYGTPLSSGADVRSNEPIVLEPFERKMVHTGVYLDLPDDMEVQVRPRSGLALKLGLTMVNAPGTIDSDYQGECNLLLINLGKETLSFDAGERLGQFVFIEGVVQADFEEVDSFDKVTERGAEGFGHTGTK